MGISGLLAILAIIIVVVTFGQQKSEQMNIKNRSAIQESPIKIAAKSTSAITSFINLPNKITKQTYPTDTQVPTLTNTNITPQQITNNSGYMYPNAHQTGSSGNTINLESSDDAALITEWYKNKIQKMGMNTTSFIVTNTNDSIDNKLVASNGNQNINVEIMKSSGDINVKITVTSP